jgi:hypothetical protein
LALRERLDVVVRVRVRVRVRVAVLVRVVLEALMAGGV